MKWRKHSIVLYLCSFSHFGAQKLTDAASFLPPIESSMPAFLLENSQLLQCWATISIKIMPLYRVQTRGQQLSSQQAYKLGMGNYYFNILPSASLLCQHDRDLANCTWRHCSWSDSNHCSGFLLLTHRCRRRNQPLFLLDDWVHSWPLSWLDYGHNE
jgi:hypothetical protein